jgi:diaminopimelate decarboxylase
MQLHNNQYEIQGIDVISLTQQFGTPLYVYDADKMAEKLHILQDSFKNVKMKAKYACKALNNISVLKLFKKYGTGLDTVSIQEVHIGLLAGFEPNEIIFTPNCVSIEEIKEAVKLGVVINIDNISILEQFGNEYGNTEACCVRLNPHIMAGGNHKISTGHIDSKFGISILQMRHLLRVIKTYNIKVTGLHMHTGSEILDYEVFLQGATILFDVAQDFPDLEFIDFGSGFKVAYQENDVVTDIAELGKKLSASFQEFCKEYGRELEIWFEPGKYLVSESGYLFVKANVIKTTPATVFVGVDSGLNHLVRPMMYDSYHHIVNMSNPDGATRVYTVVGNICETDTFGWDRKLNEVHEGDILCMQNAGAYGFRPAEVLIYEGQAHLIRKRETLEDITKNQVVIDFDKITVEI